MNLNKNLIKIFFLSQTINFGVADLREDFICKVLP